MIPEHDLAAGGAGSGVTMAKRKSKASHGKDVLDDLLKAALKTGI